MGTVKIVQQRRTFLDFRMKLTYIFLFMNVVATLAYEEDCYSEERKIRRLEKTLTKISTKYNVCLTEEGGLFDSSAFGEFCVFPFRYNGIVYNSCTYVDSRRGAEGPWCSTKTNRHGVHQKHNWGYCNENCPTEYSGSYREAFGRTNPAIPRAEVIEYNF